MTRFLAALFFLLFVVPASAQTCPTRPAGDNTNACASTAFVHQATGGTIPITVPNGGTGQTSFSANLPLIGNGTGPIGQGTVTGSGTKFVTAGLFINGNCASWNAGNLIDSGAPCGSGGTGSGTVSAGTAGQFAYYASSGTTVAGSNMFNMIATGNWFQNSGAFVQRFNDRVLIGGATIGDGNSPNVTQDWLTTYQISFGFAGGSCAVAELCVLNYSNSSAGVGSGGEPFVVGVRSAYSTSANPTPLASTAIGINDNQAWLGTGTISGTTFTVSTTTSGGVAIGQYVGLTGMTAPVAITGGSAPNWTLASAPGNISTPVSGETSWQNLVEAYYAEAHRLAFTEGQTNAAEFEVRNLGNEIVATPYQVTLPGFNNMLTDALILGCGAGESSTGQSPCSNALLISNVFEPFDNGILFANGALKSQTDGTLRAISLPSGYHIVWFTPSNTLAGYITSTSGGTLALAANAALSINGVTAVSCSGAPSASFATTLGIVTHC